LVFVGSDSAREAEVTTSRKTYFLVATAVAAGIVVAGVLVRFVQQQRSQSAYLIAISSRLAQLETKAVADVISRIGSELNANRTLLNEIELSRRQEIAEIKGQLDRTRQNLTENAARTPGCQPISKLPARIERSGRYCLQDIADYSLGRDEDAVRVLADDVTIDLQGGMLRGPGKGDTISAGVYSAGYRNLAVSNGTISGFMWGIRYDAAPSERNGGGTLVFHDLIVRDSGFRGIYVDFGASGGTQGSVAVTDSIIDRVGATTAIANPFVMGIELKYTKSCRVFRNRIIDVLPQSLGEGVGISFTRANGGCVAEENHLLNSKRPDLGRTIGVWPGSAEHDPSFIFRNNVVYNYTYGFMHNSSVTVFADNVFHSSSCSPRNVRYYDAYVAANRWVNEGAVCADHPDNFRAAAEAGDASAQFRMGTTFWEGVATSGSVEQAWHWFGLAARNGSSAAKEWIDMQRAAHKREASWWIPPEYRK
jgi:hypothetical protein